MNIKEELNKIFARRHEEYIDVFYTNEITNQNKLFPYVDTLLSRENIRYMIISPLYSSFITHSCEYKLGVYGDEMYVNEIGKSIFTALPLMKEHIKKDLEEIDTIISNAQYSEISMYELSNIKYEYSLRYLLPAKQLWKNIVINYINNVKSSKQILLLNKIDILYGMYMERTEHLINGDSV